MKTARDCLIIGFNDSDFPTFVDMVKGMGEETGTFRDLNLAYAEVDGVPQRTLDVVNTVALQNGISLERAFENCDFLWPVVLYLGSFLDRRGFSFEYVNLFHRDKDRLQELLKEFEFKSVVITTTVYVSPHPIIEIIECLRDEGADAAIIVGGPYISNQYTVMDRDELMTLFSFLGADIYVISSEGETALANILTAMSAGRGLDGIPNIAYANELGDFELSIIETEKNDLENEPINYSLFRKEDMGEFVSVRTAKSCPFNCKFCGFPQRAGKYDYTTVEYVRHELNNLRELGCITTVTFLDDTFNVPKARFREILKMMIEENYGFSWNSFYRSDHGDHETIDLMARSGCEGVFLGIESGSDRILEAMNKSARRHHYEVALANFKQAEIITYGSFIIGFPGETTESVQETIDFIETYAPDYYRAQLYYLDPATPVWRDRDVLQIRGGGFEWSHPTMTSSEATDHVEQMFLNIKNSVWAPQHGFEDWSIYYLQRRGFSKKDVSSLVRSFNNLVRAKFHRSSTSDYTHSLAEFHEITLRGLRGKHVSAIEECR